jgi:homoserine kinase type II
MTISLDQWGIRHARVTVPDRGSNNQTVLVETGGRQFVRRIYQNLDETRIAAEHRLLIALSTMDLPFAVPTPIPAADGGTYARTADGWAAMFPLIKGAHPDRENIEHQRLAGQALAELDDAMADLPAGFAPIEWKADLDHVHPAVPDVRELAAELDNGWLAETRLTAPLLPRQIVHNDWAFGNLLMADGVISGVLDFEFAGGDLAVNDLASAMWQCPNDVTTAAGWQQLAALIGGYTSRRQLSGPEITALPDLLLLRAVASAVWRAGRWRLGLSDRAESTDGLRRAELLAQWLDRNAGRLRGLAAG